jgi:hypothetical protein
MKNSVCMYWGIFSLFFVLLNVHIVGSIFSIGKQRAPLSAQNGHNPVPLFVMLQLDTVDPATNQLKDPEGLKYQLLELQRAGVDGVMVDVWWGIVEKKGPKLYNWTGYEELVDLVASSGLKLQWCVLPSCRVSRECADCNVATAKNKRAHTIPPKRSTCTYALLQPALSNIRRRTPARAIARSFKITITQIRFLKQAQPPLRHAPKPHARKHGSIHSSTRTQMDQHERGRFQRAQHPSSCDRVWGRHSSLS